MDWLTSIINTSADAYYKVKSADALKSEQAYGDTGAFSGVMQPAQGGGVSPLLLIGGALILVLFLRD